MYKRNSAKSQQELLQGVFKVYSLVASSTFIL